MDERWEKRLASWRTTTQAENRWRRLRPLSKRQPPFIEMNGRCCIDFSSNDYLGLSCDPRLIAGARDALERWGCGAGASRLVSGDLELFEDLECRLAEFKRHEAALVFSSGFLANVSLVGALASLAGRELLAFTDRLNHASLHVGFTASGVRQIRYRHNDLAHLEQLLQEHDHSAACRMIVSETVFSMDGDMADVPGLVELSKRHGALLFLDEAHATGVLGVEGRGLAAGLGADVVMGTFSKAFGCAGAYVACDQALRDFFINRCSGFIYSTPLSPAVLGAVSAALELIPALDSERAHVSAMGEALRRSLTELGFQTVGVGTPIIPVIAGDDSLALRWAAELEEDGIRVVAIRPPTVPEGSARLRISLSAAHTNEHLARLVAALSRLRAEGAG